MSTCTFFGHRDYRGEKDDFLREAIRTCITSHHVDTFYVGNQGGFDRAVRRILTDLSVYYPFRYYIVLAYVPTTSDDIPPEYAEHTILPDGLEAVPPRFAIDRCNHWMIEHADFVIAHITRTHGGAAKFVNIAARKKRTVIWV